MTVDAMSSNNTPNATDPNTTGGTLVSRGAQRRKVNRMPSACSGCPIALVYFYIRECFFKHNYVYLIATELSC